jgi:RND family efflux transporter MFP subunit
MKWNILLFPLLILVLAGCRSGRHENEQTASQLPAVKVEVITAELETAPLRTEVVGTVQPVHRADIAAKVTGTIEKIPVKLGSRVREGDLLVKITAGEISARVIQAQAQLEQARRNLERERKLLEKNAATAENVKSLEEAFRIAEAAYREATVMLSYTTINAPFDGQIISKNANVGDLATPGQTLLRLENDEELQVVTQVPEGLVLQISPGDTLPVTVPAAELDLAGRVAEIAPAADPLSRTSMVKLDIDENESLRSGQFARVGIPGAGRNTLFVPEAALQFFGQMKRIFVVADNTARLRLVRTGRTADGRVEILTGLEPGEKVVIRHEVKLADGQPIIIEQ